MKNKEKSYMGAICIFLLFTVLFIGGDAKESQASENETIITAQPTTEAGMLSVTVRINNPKQEEYTLSYEGLTDATMETVEAVLDNKNQEHVIFSANPLKKEGILEFVAETPAPFEVTFDVSQEAGALYSKILLSDTTGETKIEKKLNFTSLKDFSREQGLYLDVQTRAWSGADAFPAHTIPLNAVFNPAIGSGPVYLDDDKVLQIVGSTGQKGAIWSKRQIDLTRDFRFTTFIYLGNGTNDSGSTSTSVADGITMTFHNDPRGQAAIGEGGSALAAYGNGSNSNNHIRNALSLEFDPYGTSGASSDGILSLANRRGGHIAVLIPAANNTSGSARTHNGLLKTTTTANAANRMSNDTWRALDITWVASTRTLKYTVENFGEASYTVANLQTTFGGTKVYWGFTGATGGLWMDARIAMLEIPGSAAHDLKVQNMTQTPTAAPASQVVGYKDDTVRFTDSITPDEDAILSGDGASVVITMPEGLDYKPNTLFFEGNQISDTDLEFSGQTIKLSNKVLIENKPYELTFDAEVVTDEVAARLPVTVEVFSVSGSTWGTSEEAAVEIPDESSVTFHYFDENSQPIATAKTITDIIGKPYSESPSTIQYYTYDRTIGEASGYFTEDEKDVYFYYKRNQTAITVAFIDDEGQSLCSAKNKTYAAGTTVNLAAEMDIQAQIDELIANDYALIQRPENETQLTVPAQAVTVNYVFKHTGKLSLVSAPSVLQFGSQANRLTTRVESPTYDEELVISDERVTRTKWRLTVELTKPLTHMEDTDRIISEAIRYKRGTTEYKLSETPIEIYEELNGTAGEVSISNTWSDGGDGFKLEVSGGNVTKLGRYQAELLWQLIDAY